LEVEESGGWSDGGVWSETKKRRWRKRREEGWRPGLSETLVRTCSSEPSYSVATQPQGLLMFLLVRIAGMTEHAVALAIVSWRQASVNPTRMHENAATIY
jgi:hypothetical protein